MFDMVLDFIITWMQIRLFLFVNISWKKAIKFCYGPKIGKSAYWGHNDIILYGPKKDPYLVRSSQYSQNIVFYDDLEKLLTSL